MPPRIQNHDDVALTATRAPRVVTDHALQHVSQARTASESDAYWHWPADDGCKCSDTTTTTNNDDIYWAEEQLTTKHDIDVDYFIDYSQNSILGKGTETTVRKAVCRKTNERFAVKSVRKIYTQEYQRMKEEAALLQKLTHNAIIKCHSVYEDHKSYHIVLELCKGKEVYDEVASLAKENRTMSEHKAATIVRQVLQALAYLHDKKSVHRDIKLENILFKTKKKGDLTIRLVDFGLATPIEEGQMLKEKVGSPYYVAPEVLEQHYNQACDVWSVGVLTYALLCGEAPFVGKSTEATLNKIRDADTSLLFRQYAWKDISEEAKEFVKACLQKDPSRRPTAEELWTEHPWIVQNAAATPDQHVKKPKISTLLNKMFHRR